MAHKEEYVYGYTLSMSADPTVFMKACHILEQHDIYPVGKLLEDVDGSLIRYYSFHQQKICVASDYEIDAVFIDSQVDLSEVLKGMVFCVPTSIETIKREIDIAGRALTEAGFADLLSNDTNLCEVYHRPAHNNQNTIFARLYVSAGRLYAIYAKAEVFHLGWKITKESFEATEAANLHGGSEGRIVCGIHHLDAFDEEEICQALREAASLSVPEKQGFTLDDESYFVSSSEGQFLFMRSCTDLSFVGVESIRLLIRVIDAIGRKDR